MAIGPFNAGAVERISRILGEPFTGTQIDGLLQAANIAPQGESTKWRRLNAALSAEQGATNSGNCVVVLINEAARPVRWSDPQRFNDFRDEMNEVLAFSGLILHSDGQIGRRPIATTHDEAMSRSRRLRDEMQRRNGHAEIYRYCSRELVADDCFNVVLEATKGVSERLRQMTGHDLDGHQLVMATLDGVAPMVALNGLRTDTERNEQRGISNILKGVASAFRNPLAHEPKVLFHVTEADALDLLSTLSLVHRRLDAAVVLRRVVP
ncbi:MAG: TIGR02391 family protein [Candidatus Nanopelagicales bacterium]